MSDSHSRRKNEEERSSQESNLGEYLCLGRRRGGREREAETWRYNQERAISGPREEASVEVERPIVK